MTETVDTPRKLAIARNAELRAKITAFLNTFEGPFASTEHLKKAIPELAEDGLNPSSLLSSMVANGLIYSAEIQEGGSPKRFGYSMKPITLEASPPKEEHVGKRGYNKKLDRPEVRVENDRIVIEHPRCRVIVELK